jgi:hypothetical protein
MKLECVVRLRSGRYHLVSDKSIIKSAIAQLSKAISFADAFTAARTLLTCKDLGFARYAPPFDRGKKRVICLADGISRRNASTQ